ncbi:MAG: hypothetical protein BGO78_07795 [Chloroflexi bacterium 44-23]|nr:MAG: hypothetical protein BGO78_07795 [Chloroflexi bacterium 44-23]
MKEKIKIIFNSSRSLFNLGMVLLLLLALIIPGKVSAAGEAGLALSFDGENDYVKLGVSEDILGSNWRSTKSFSMWIKPQGSASICMIDDVADCEQIFSNQPHFFGISRGVIGGQDRLWVWNYDGTYRKIPISYQVDEWVNVTFVHAGGFLRAYRNGNLVGQVASGDTFYSENVTTTNLLLGAFVRADRTAAFEGLIDEVRIYSKELLPADISATLKSPLNGDETGLRAYYQMSDGSGTTLTDDSINSFNGTLMNGFETIGNGPTWVNSNAWDYPVADDQLISTPEDTPLNITLSGSPAQGGSLIYHLQDGPTHGALTGTIPDYIYTPQPDYNGPDSLTFYVTEGSLQSSLATITIEITPVNDAPIAAPDTYWLDMNKTLVVDAPGILENDSDIDSDQLEVGSYEYLGGGDLTVHNDGSFTYIPTTGFYGVDQFSYQASDGSILAESVTVTLNVRRTFYYLYLPLVKK